MFYKKLFLSYFIKKPFTFLLKFLSRPIIKNGRFKIERFKLSLEESRYIIKFLARKGNINNYKRKSNDELLHALKESEKQEKNKNNQQQIKSKNKERIEVITEQFKELPYKLSKSELKEIKRRLYMLENKKGLLG